jgi:thioredoxin-like negative regulator of GroEL
VINLTTHQELNDHIQSNQAVLVLFGGVDCGVCQVIKPQLEKLIGQHYPEIKTLYADCQSYPELGAQASVFSLPVVRVYFEGQLFLEEIKAFSLGKLLADLERPYALMLG